MVDLWHFSATAAGARMHVVSVIYALANVTLTILNIYWFWRIIAVVLMGKKFNKEEVTGKEK